MGLMDCLASSLSKAADEELAYLDGFVILYYFLSFRTMGTPR